MKILLETKRLIIKHSDLKNIDTVYKLLSDPEIMRYVGKGVKTFDETKQALEKMIAHQNKHGFSLGDVYEKETGTFVGRAGLVYLEMNDQQPEIEIGYLLHKQFWKKGYATELAKAIIAWGFKHLSIDKLVAVLRPENQSSRRVLERSGMHYSGRAYCYDGEVSKYEIQKNNIDYQKIIFMSATLNDYPTIQNMGRFYVYDMSEYMGWGIPEDGLYECIDFKKYFETENNFPFIIRYENEIVGFVIVGKNGSEANIDFIMAQFFVLRKFKNKGIARFIAHQCFDRFNGTWEVMVMPGNEGAYRFWRSIINNYTQGNVLEYSKNVLHFENNRFNIFKFSSNNGNSQ